MGNIVPTGGSSKIPSKRVVGTQASPDVTESLPRLFTLSLPRVFYTTPTPAPVPAHVPIEDRAEIILPGAPDFHPSVNGRNGWSMVDIYDVGDELGKGSFGHVYCSSHKKNQKIVTAVKVTKPTILDRNLGPLVGYDGIEARCQEVRALLKLQGGSRMLQLYEIFWNNKELHIVTEKLSVDLNAWIKRQGTDFDENMAKKVTKKLLYAMKFMHKRGVVHRDMKPHNIMFTVGDDSRSDYRSLKVIDFGMAKVLKREEEFAGDFCGTLGFLAPEIYQGLPYRFEVDMFAVGVILFQMLSGGEKPFPSEKLRDATIELNYNFESDTWGSDLHLESAKNLIRNLLCFRTVRLNATEALNHEWLEPTKNSVRLTSTFIPVEPDTTGAFINTMPGSSVWPPYKTSNIARLICLAIVVLGLVIVGGVCGAGKCSIGAGRTAPYPSIRGPPTPTPSGGYSPSTVAPSNLYPSISDAPTSAFPAAATTTFPPTVGRIYEFLPTLPDYTRAELWNRTTPQSKALDWLESDPYFNNSTLPRQTVRFALATLYHATNGDSWSNHDLWLTPSHECDWFSNALTACPDGEFLTILRLKNISMTGSIPAELSLLTDLTELEFYGNPTLSGTIPTELSLLTNLKDFSLSSSSLSGTIPTELAHLKNLQILSLYGNILTGTIPTELALLAELENLYLSDNNLSGTIPTGLVLLANLQQLYLYGNLLSGTIPTELGLLTDLKDLYLHDNDLNGTIPTELGLLAKLQSLDLAGHFLAGTIPTELALLADLTELILYDNDLNGTIPIELAHLKSLHQLYLYGNILTGTIPTELALLADLTAVALYDNDLSGTIPTELARLTNLQSLYLWSNRLTGTIPTGLALLADLNLLDLSLNNLSGTIPTELALLANLQIFYLLGNSLLSGTIPSGLCVRNVDIDVTSTGVLCQSGCTIEAQKGCTATPAVRTRRSLSRQV